MRKFLLYSSCTQRFVYAQWRVKNTRTSSFSYKLSKKNRTFRFSTNLAIAYTLCCTLHFQFNLSSNVVLKTDVHQKSRKRKFQLEFSNSPNGQKTALDSVELKVNRLWIWKIFSQKCQQL
jgi:hypothetical protein